MDCCVKVYFGRYQVAKVGTLVGVPITLSSKAIVCFPKGFDLVLNDLCGVEYDPGFSFLI